MSRSVKDLRDLICVSRLTFHESEEEFISDDDEKLSREASGLSLNSTIDSPTPRSERIVSPDSGLVTDSSPSAVGSSLSKDGGFLIGESVFVTDIGNGDGIPMSKPPINTAMFGKTQKKKKTKKKGSLPTEPPRHDLLKTAPLPPVASIPGSPAVTEKELLSKKNRKNSSDNLSFQKRSQKQRINFDDMLTYMDATIVANWLTRSNDSLKDMMAFCSKGDNFVKFAHFWLADFPDDQKQQIFTMEHNFLIDELQLAFAVGRDSGAIVRRDLNDMCAAVFKEYPKTLLSVQGPHLFLNYLDILISQKHAEYRSLLADVRCSTSNRQYAQWLLATRSFALVNVWSSILNFYRNLIGDKPSLGNPIHELSYSNEKIQHRRMLQAIGLGYIDVIHFLLVNNHVDPNQTDSHRRSLVFSAVMHNQTPAVKYLVTRVNPPIEINLPADTGNTALHAAANNGTSPIVELLCNIQGIDVNCINPQCERATPLHLAAMHGHEKIVACLLHHGADPSLKMGTTTACDLARDFDHLEVVELLGGHSLQV